MYAPLYAVQWKLRESGATWACRQAERHSGRLFATDHAAAPLIIRVIRSHRNATREYYSSITATLSNELEKGALITGIPHRSSQRRSLSDARRPTPDARRSPANYSPNIAITIRVIGIATDFHDTYIPCASSSPLITRSADNNARARVVRHDNKPADAIIFPLCSSSGGGLMAHSRLAKGRGRRRGSELEREVRAFSVANCSNH